MAKVNITLTAQHTHAGKTYQAGETIEIEQSDADFIVKNRIGKVTKITKTKTKEKNNGTR
ncbi:hypothetical protein IFE17_09960 [Actinobacillus sp. GY-402]|nr:hypothetical protein IFE17_09340 [Actinobacillus sp. GY-402]QOF67443.1 hypothetical protein IFE17_09960 [Actinobacillus sp. GY-402]